MNKGNGRKESVKHTSYQKGFAVIEAAIILLIMALLAAGSWYVWQNSKKTQEGRGQSSGASQSKKDLEASSEKQEPIKTISLLNGEVNFVDDGTWKVATGGYFDAESGRCGRGAGFDEACLDHKMLIPADETFTNPDQFQVNIAVFENDGTPGTSLGQWVDLNVGPGGSNPKRSHPTLAGQEAYRYEVAYSEDDVRLVYGVAVGDKIVVVQSNFFKGSHNSFKTTNDYLPLISQVDKLAESISIKQ